MTDEDLISSTLSFGENNDEERKSDSADVTPPSHPNEESNEAVSSATNKLLPGDPVEENVSEDVKHYRCITGSTVAVPRVQNMSWEELITYNDKEPPDKDMLCFTHGSHNHNAVKSFSEFYFSAEMGRLNFKFMFFDLKKMSHDRIYLRQLGETGMEIDMHRPSFLVKFPPTIVYEKVKGYMRLNTWLKKQNNARKIALGWLAFLHIRKLLPSYPSCTVFIRDSDEDTLNIKVDTCQILFDESLQPESTNEFLENAILCKDMVYSKELNTLLDATRAHLCYDTNSQVDILEYLKKRLSEITSVEIKHNTVCSGYGQVVIEDLTSLQTYLSRIDLKSERIISLDCEGITKTSTALLQLAFYREKMCLLVRLCKIKDGVPHSLLADLLDDGNIIKVGVGIKHDGMALKKMGLTLKGFVDLQHLPLKYKLAGRSLKKLTGHFLHLELDKSTKHRSGDWYMDELTKEQVIYACMDVIVVFPLLEELLKTQMETLLEGECESYRRLKNLRHRRYKPKEKSVLNSYQIFPLWALKKQYGEEILKHFCDLQFQLETPLPRYTEALKNKMKSLTLPSGRKESLLHLIHCCIQYFLDNVYDTRLARLSLPPMTSENSEHWSVRTRLIGHKALCMLLCLNHLCGVEEEEAFFQRLKEHFPIENLWRAYCGKFISFASPIIELLLKDDISSTASENALFVTSQQSFPKIVTNRSRDRAEQPDNEVVIEDKDVKLSSAEEGPLAVSNSSCGIAGENALFVTPQCCFEPIPSPAKVQDQETHVEHPEPNEVVLEDEDSLLLSTEERSLAVSSCTSGIAGQSVLFITPKRCTRTTLIEDTLRKYKHLNSADAYKQPNTSTKCVEVEQRLETEEDEVKKATGPGGGPNLSIPNSNISVAQKDRTEEQDDGLNKMKKVQIGQDEATASNITAIQFLVDETYSDNC